MLIMDAKKLSSVGRNLFQSIEFDPDEKLIAEIRKHPFGLFLVYFTGLSVAAALFLLLVILPSTISGDAIGAGFNLAALRPLLAVIGGILTLLAIAVTGLGAYLYQNNVVLVTSEKIAQ